MNKKLFWQLVSFLLVITAAFFLLSEEPSESSSSRTRDLFSGVSVDEISKIAVVQGPSEVTIERQEDQWTLPERGGYRADASKVRALLLKLLSLSVSQQVTDNPESFEALGLTDEKVEAGNAMVTLYDEDGEDMGGIILGDMRQAKLQTGHQVPNGQFIRRARGDEAYLIAAPITTSALLSYWFDPKVTNILHSRVVELTQFSNVASSEQVEFALTRKDGMEGELEYRGEVPEGKNISQQVTLLRDGLENLRARDVFPAEATEVADLTFDMKSRYSLSNGLLYSVYSAKADGKGYLRLEVEFDETSVVKPEAEQSADEMATDSENSDAENAEEEKDKAKAQKDIAPSNKGEASRINADYAGWIYQVDEYQVDKFRLTKDSIFETPAEETP